jgi:hypothetical protein
MLIQLRQVTEMPKLLGSSKYIWPRYVNMLKLQFKFKKSENLKAKTEIVPIQRLDERNMAMRLIFSVFVYFFGS